MKRNRPDDGGKTPGTSLRGTGGGEASPRKDLFLSPLWGCNQRCLFCAKGRPPAGAAERMSAAEVINVLESRRREGCNHLFFDGGEPTLRKDLPALAAKALELGFEKVQVITNGVALAGGKMVRELCAIPGSGRAISFSVSLHSHLPRVSDALTRAPGTFALTLAGLDAIKSSGLGFSIYHVITTSNFRALPRFAAFAAEKFPRVNTVTFSHIFPSAGLPEGTLRCYPKITAAAPYLVEACVRLEAAGIRHRASDCGIVPMCLMRGSEQLFLKASAEAGKYLLTYDTGHTGPLQVFRKEFNDEFRAKGPRCGSCFVGRACLGMWKFYLEKFGCGELRPFSAAHFRGLARGGGTAALDLSSCLAGPDPAALARIAVIDLRCRGFSRLKLKAAAVLGGDAAGLKAFARAAGFTLA